jgi:hypothetical protein
VTSALRRALKVVAAPRGIYRNAIGVSDFGRGVSDSANHDYAMSSLNRPKALTLKCIAVTLVWLRSCSNYSARSPRSSRARFEILGERGLW